MDDFKITQDMVHEEFHSPFLNIFDYRYAEGKHYYNATRRDRDRLAAPKSDADFRRMLPDAVSCIVIVELPDRSERLLLTHEYRYPAGRALLSVPAGLIDAKDFGAGSPILDAARREIREETGIEMTDEDTLEIINPLLFSSPGMTDESNAIVCAHIHLQDASILNNSGTEGPERIGDYELVTAEKAADYFHIGRDDHGFFYSVYTYIALSYFVLYNTLAGKQKDSEAGNDKDTDATTGLLSRHGLLEYLGTLLPEIAQNGHPLLVISVRLQDLDRLEKIYGEDEAQMVLCLSAGLISDTLQHQSTGGRIAYNEFVLVQEVLSDEQTLSATLRKDILKHFENYNSVSGKDYSVDPSIAILTIGPNDGYSPEQILSLLVAEHSADKDDEIPRSRYLAPQDEDDDPQTRRLVNQLIDANDFLYNYQPIVSAKTGQIMGYEALMRTASSYRLSPLTILKYATKDNRLADIERATMFNVMANVKEFLPELGDRKIFVNSIPGYYLDDRLFDLLTEQYGEVFPNIVIEVTEETDVEDTTLHYLTDRSTAQHFQIAVDDFGTGYSNVTNLLKFLPNYVKIDRFLITEIHLDQRKQHFVNAIIQFAHDNGFQALAEGVETADELRCVIRMGVDLIQGYYTARPAPHLLDTLPSPVLAEISKANLDTLSNARQKVYLVQDERELSLIDLSLQKYSVLLLSGGDLTLVGNPDFVSAVSIRVKDRSSCRLTLRNVSVGDVDETPCIDLGKESQLTLNIEGTNLLNGNGIRVPETAELLLTGDGTLHITPTFTNAYAIGNDYQSAFGRISSHMLGMIQININGENCVCIGGKSSSATTAIDLHSGVLRSVCAASNCVCIGSYRDSTPVFIHGMDLDIDVRVEKGTLIGSMYGYQKTTIDNTKINIYGSGNQVSGIGSIGEAGGEIILHQCGTLITLNGWNTAAIGSPAGGMEIRMSHCEIELTVEANLGMAIGCRDISSLLEIVQTSLRGMVNSANAVMLGSTKERSTIENDAFALRLNGSEASLERLLSGLIISGS
ncbi:MAG: EAL domain-containing protein [Lachnospiraceae bacterium]|nr:EAL domain-containing protein [Lachnospiraceae bacterium]